jgi:hypothetical protein
VDAKRVTSAFADPNVFCAAATNCHGRFGVQLMSDTLLSPSVEGNPTRIGHFGVPDRQVLGLSGRRRNKTLSQPT